MLLSKLKKVENRVKVIEDDQHFHLDEQQQNLAFEAKLQLDECSKEISDELIYQQKTLPRKNMMWGTNLRATQQTNASDNDTKTILINKNQRFSKKKNENGNSDNYFSYRKHKVCGSILKSPRVPQTQPIDFKIKNQIFNELKKQNCLSKYIQEVQIQNRKKLVKSPRILSGSFRCYTSNHGKNCKQGSKSIRPITSPRRKANLQSTYDEFIEKYTPRSSYSFNDAIKGDRINLLQHVQYQRYAQRPRRMLTEHNSNFNTSRELKINLRPEFMKLIQKIKEKQQAKSKRNRSTSVSVKGRRAI